jgi:hypothetical protein
MPRTIELHSGPCRWEPFTRHTLALLGIASLLAASTPPAWKIAALVALALAWRFTRAHPRRATLRLFADGTASLLRNGHEQPVEMTGQAWSSRVFCVVEVRRFDVGVTERLQICAARQSASDYRRLLGLLRLGAFAPQEDCLDH